MAVYAMNDRPDIVYTAWQLPQIDGHDLNYFIDDANTPAWASALMTEDHLTIEDNAGTLNWKITFTDDPTMTAFSDAANVLCMKGDGSEVAEFNSLNYTIWGNPPFYDDFTEVTG